MKHVKFIKRVKKWFTGRETNGDRQYYIDLTLQGKNRTFLRTTSRPCNCEMCTCLKYKRTSKHKVIKAALKE